MNLKILGRCATCRNPYSVLRLRAGGPTGANPGGRPAAPGADRAGGAGEGGMLTGENDAKIREREPR